jgi:uncharacterized protein YkwD
MVNKVALSILAIIILMSVTAGGIVGLQVGGDGTLDTIGADEGAAEPSTGDSEESSGGTAAATSTPVPESTSTPLPTVTADEFNETRIEMLVQQLLNDRRQAEDIQDLRSHTPLDAMSQFHSGNMATQGYVSQSADGFTTADRYNRFNLSSRCRIVDDTNTGVRDGRELEVVGKFVAGQAYENSDEETVVDVDERAVATTIVDRWFANKEARKKLTLQNADEVGIGVVVQADGDTWVTADLC